MAAEGGICPGRRPGVGAVLAAAPGGRAESGDLTADAVLFDSHCHLTDERLLADLPGVLDRARAARVTRFVTIASDADDAARALTLARAHEGLFCTAGVHPHAVGEAAADALGRVADLLAEPEVVAVGETGLDFYYDNAPRETQRRLFEAHLALAVAHDLPAVVHSRSADEDTAAMIAEYAGSARGVLHCFAGSPDLLRAGLDAGWWVSFSGLVTFPKFERRALIEQVPADRLLIETDSPYLAPVPYRGRTNEPAYLVHVAAAVAEARREAPAEIARRTTRNAHAFYRLPYPSD
ncbi:MAG TPA: TatD family hydrolase [Longimicrobiales bacterium]|nr:TatD family hydrolase [Longimicrobiales bacterium]